jgi:hypothetical protein
MKMEMMEKIETWEDVKDYCIKRLDEIRGINEGHPCPSAFVCIAAFMGFLSRLAFGTNIKGDHKDGEWFKKFIQCYMPAKYHAKNFAQDQQSLMYNIFRCGIVHAMSFDCEISENRTTYLAEQDWQMRKAPQLFIAHDSNLSPYCDGERLKDFGKPNSYVLVASVLCDDLRKAINKMFESNSVKANSVEFVHVQRPIRGVVVTADDGDQTDLENMSSITQHMALSGSCPICETNFASAGVEADNKTRNN